MPEVRAKRHHCVECNHWSVAPQYVRRHMTQRHPECADLIQKCIQDIKASRLGLQNPCQFCGQSYKRRDAHLRACIGVFNGVYLHRRLSRGKVLTLTITSSESLLHHARPTGAAGTHRTDDGDSGTRPSTNPGPDPTGASSSTAASGCGLDGPGGGSLSREPRPPQQVAKARPKRRAARQGQEPRPTTAPSIRQLLEAGGGSGDRQPRQPHPRRSLEDQDQSNKEGEAQELRSVMSMLTMLVIRQEAQQLISRQDTDPRPGQPSPQHVPGGTGVACQEEGRPSILVSPQCEQCCSSTSSA